jgi:hypothetical protein
MITGQKILLAIVVMFPVVAMALISLAWAFFIWIIGLSASKSTVQGIALNVMYSIDQLGNAVIGGDPDETISSRAGRAIQEGRCKGCKLLCWLLNKVDPNHCNKYLEPGGDRDVFKL